jgi:glycosyltransferase involved in cell wall biosynthesis
MSKILHVTTVPLSLMFLSGQVDYLREKGFEIYYLSSPGVALRKHGQLARAGVFGIKMHRSITPLKDLVAIAKIYFLLRKLNPEIVHAHTPKAGLLAMIASSLACVPIRIYHIHGLPLVTAVGIKKRLLRLSEKVACRLADMVFCVSPSILQVAVTEGLCAKAKARVFKKGSIDGVDARGRLNPLKYCSSVRNEIRRKYNIPIDALVIGFVGRAVKDKGLVTLAESWKALRAEFSALYLLIVGPFERQDSPPLEIERLLRTDPRIRLAGYQEEVASFYSAMDIFTLPSYREGFGLAAAEASAMCLPVIATQIPGCIDVVIDGVTGTLVPPRETEALTNAIRIYIKNPRLRKIHGKGGRKHVLCDFQPEPIWEATYQAYTSLLRKKNMPIPETTFAAGGRP